MPTWTPRIRGPALFTRGRASTVELEVWSETGLQEPTSGTITVYSEDDTVIVSAQAVTVSTSTLRAVATIASGSLPSTLQFSDCWRVEWSLLLAGETVLFHQDAQLIRHAWTPYITPSDLIAACQPLSQSYNLGNSDDCKALSEVIRAGVEDVQAQMCSAGRRPWLIFDGWKVNRYAVVTILARLVRGMLLDQNPANFTALDKLATTWEEEAVKRWSEMSFRYDEGQSGVGGEQVQKSGGSPTIRIGITR